MLNFAGNHIARDGDAVYPHSGALGQRSMRRAGHGRHSAGTALGRRGAGLPFLVVRTTW